MLRKNAQKSPVVSHGEGSEEEVGDSSLVQCKTRFVQISHIFFFYEAHFCCSPFLISCPDVTLSYTVGDLGTILPPSLLTHPQLFINTFWDLHWSSLKPLVLSNVVQWGSLSSSIQGYNSSLMNHSWTNLCLCGPRSCSQWPSLYLHLPFPSSKYLSLPTEVTFVC